MKNSQYVQSAKGPLGTLTVAIHLPDLTVVDDPEEKVAIKCSAGCGEAAEWIIAGLNPKTGEEQLPEYLCDEDTSMLLEWIEEGCTQ